MGHAASQELKVRRRACWNHSRHQHALGLLRSLAADCRSDARTCAHGVETERGARVVGLLRGDWTIPGGVRRGHRTCDLESKAFALRKRGTLKSGAGPVGLAGRD